jgi:tetratricopeptide (TPR) repeat protein
VHRSPALAIALAVTPCLLSAAPAPAQILVLKESPKQTVSRSSPSALPSVDAARALALSFEDAVRRGARDEAFAAIDFEALMQRASDGVPTTDKVKRTFRDGARAAWSGDAGIVPSLVAAVTAGGSFSWLRSSEKDGVSTALFRLVHADASAPEYVELILDPRGTKAAIAVDVSTSAEGVSHARTLRRWLLALVADAGRSLPLRIAGEDRAFALAGKTFEAIDLAFEQGRNADALAAWATLPAELRTDPSVLLSRLRVALAAGGEAFSQALHEARRVRPGDARLELIAIDGAISANCYQDALESIALAETGLGGDPYLLALRGSILRTLGRDDDARKACRAAIDADAGLEDAHWTLLAIAVDAQRFDEALAVLTRMDERFEIDWKELANAPAYRAFLDSAVGARWRAKLAVKR